MALLRAIVILAGLTTIGNACMYFICRQTFQPWSPQLSPGKCGWQVAKPIANVKVHSKAPPCPPNVHCPNQAKVRSACKSYLPDLTIYWIYHLLTLPLYATQANKSSPQNSLTESMASQISFRTKSFADVLPCIPDKDFCMVRWWVPSTKGDTNCYLYERCKSQLMALIF